MGVSLAENPDHFISGQNDSFLAGTTMAATNSCGISSGPEYNETVSLIYMRHPEEMLSPIQRNSFFLHIVITHSITFIIGVLGNVAAVSVMVGDRKSRNATNMFLVSLAAADLLLLVLCVPLETAQYFVIQWDVNGAVCKMSKYVELLSALASVLNLCAVSLERFVVIVHPMRSRSLCTISNCRKAILVVWVIAVLLSLPVILVTDVFSVAYCNEETFVRTYYCTGEGMPIVVYQLIILFVAPGLLMVIFYTYVIRELWKSTHNITMLTQSKSMKSSTRTLRESTVVNDSGTRANLSGNHIARASREQQQTLKSVLHGNGAHFPNSRPRTVPLQARHNNKGEDAKKARKQVIKMLILVVIVFLFCWGPKLILNILLKSETLQMKYTNWLYSCRVWFSLIPFVHSCINPIIYSFMSKNFRRSMQKQFKRCCFFLGCGCFSCGQNHTLIPLRSTTRTPHVDSVCSNNYCVLGENMTRNTEMDSVAM